MIPRLSVVVATYNRGALLERLLEQLSQQTLAPETYEVVVVDDGSATPCAPRLASLRTPYALRVETQANAGAAAARDRGIRAARGELIVIVDDDMQVGPGFLAGHLARHTDGSRKVVLGRILPGGSESEMPLFERWHAALLDRMAANVAAGRQVPRGVHLYTGNVSLRRADYLAVGGFDPSFALTEDSELGLRLEESGVAFELAPEAWSLHESDHTSLEKWMRRSFLYGVYSHRVARKHPEKPDPDPWAALTSRNVLTRPFLLAAALAPSPARHLSRAVWAAASACDRTGLTRAALAATSVVFGIEFFRGVRSEVPRLSAAAREVAASVRRANDGSAAG